MIYCMWQGPDKNEECLNEGSIVLKALCRTKDCWTQPREYFACEKHCDEARQTVDNPEYGCSRCNGPVEILRMTSV